MTLVIFVPQERKTRTTLSSVVMCAVEGYALSSAAVAGSLVLVYLQSVQLRRLSFVAHCAERRGECGSD